ncbi:hypothetical protein D3C86_1745380 [compost metagenome]
MGAEHGRQLRKVEKSVLQAIAEAVFQRLGQHALIERGMEGQYRAIANELHEVEQGVGRIAAGGDCTGPKAMDQHAGAGFHIGLLQGALELLAQVDGAVFYHYGAN